MKRALLIGIFLSLFALPAKTDELDEILEYLNKNALSINIVARLLDHNDVEIWNAESSRITVAGRAVNIILVGREVVIDASITAFGSIDKTLILVANGELWISGNPTEGMKYKSFVKSLPVLVGESIILFPFGSDGVAVDDERKIHSVQLEIQLLPYQSETASPE